MLEDLILSGRGERGRGEGGCENSSPRENCRCKTGGRPSPPPAVTRKLEVSYTGVAAPHLHIRTPYPPADRVASTAPFPSLLSLPSRSDLPLTGVLPPQAAQQVVLRFSARLSASLIFVAPFFTAFPLTPLPSCLSVCREARCPSSRVSAAALLRI